MRVATCCKWAHTNDSLARCKVWKSERKAYHPEKELKMIRHGGSVLDIHLLELGPNHYHRKWKGRQLYYKLIFRSFQTFWPILDKNRCLTSSSVSGYPFDIVFLQHCYCASYVASVGVYHAMETLHSCVCTMSLFVITWFRNYLNTSLIYYRLLILEQINTGINIRRPDLI